MWAKEAAKKTTDSFFYKKNLALLESHLLASGGKKKYAKESIALWQEVAESAKFWDLFFKYYELNDDLSTNRETLETFRDNVTTELSDHYAEVSKRRGDKSIISTFSKAFKAKGGKVEKEHLNPIFERINKEIGKLEALNVSEDNVFDEEESEAINASLDSLQSDLKQLKKLGLQDDSQTKTVRDRAASALRAVVLDLYNNLGETDNALAVLQLAADISGTDSFRSQLKDEVKTIRNNKKNEDKVAPILQLIKNERYEEALEAVEKGLKSRSANKDLKDFYTLYKKIAITNIAGQRFKQAHDHFNAKKFETASAEFNAAAEIIEDNLHLFDLNEKGVRELTDEINSWTQTLNDANIESFDAERQKVYAITENDIPDGATREAYVILVDSYMMHGLSQYAIRKMGSPTTRVLRKAWGYGWWLLIIGGIGIAVASGGGGSSSDECATLESQLNSVESRATAARSAGDTAGYNALVPEQNRLASEMNTKCN